MVPLCRKSDEKKWFLSVENLTQKSDLLSVENKCLLSVENLTEKVILLRWTSDWKKWLLSVENLTQESDLLSVENLTEKSVYFLSKIWQKKWFFSVEHLTEKSDYFLSKIWQKRVINFSSENSKIPSKIRRTKWFSFHRKSNGKSVSCRRVRLIRVLFTRFLLPQKIY